MSRGGGNKMNYEMWMLARRMNKLVDEWMHARFQGDPSSAWQPAVDVIESEEHLCILVELAAMKREEIDVRFEGSAVTVSGTRTVKEVHGPVQVHLMEVARGAFRRTLQLPFEVTADDVEILYANGLLDIKMRKPTRRRGKR